MEMAIPAIYLINNCFGGRPLEFLLFHRYMFSKVVSVARQQATIGICGIMQAQGLS